MKKMPILIIVPLIAVMGIVVVAMGIKVFAPTSEVAVTQPTEFPNAVGNTTESKPSTFLGSLFGQKAPTPTPTPSSAADMSRELKDTYDDGGKSELDALSKDAASL